MKRNFPEDEIQRTIIRYELETDEGGTPREKAIQILQGIAATRSLGLYVKTTRDEK